MPYHDLIVILCATVIEEKCILSQHPDGQVSVRIFGPHGIGARTKA